MSASWNWPGSRWWRVDLHTHSPASHDYKQEPDRAAQDWVRWVTTAKTAGLHAVALTDHNTGQGITAVQTAATTISDAPVILPGVEITASDGTHLLLIFDSSCTQQHVDEVLTLAKVPVDQRGKPEARSTLSVEEILLLECDRGFIAIGAHVNGKSGLLEHDGLQRIAELRNPRLAAVEIDPTRAVDTTWFDGTRTQIARIIPQIQCSDSHAFSEVGRRFTWVKMTKPSAEGLRLALLDGSGSLQPADKNAVGDPNKHADCVIESMTVTNAKYVGKPKALTIDFNPWLNAVIGSRGTGKSTIVDFLRTVLRRENELNDDGGESSLRTAFSKRMRVPANRKDEGLLTSETTVEVTYRKDGERFVLSWAHDGKSQAIVRLDGDQRVAEVGDIRERFPVRIYSQKQLFDLARQPNALLTVIDDSADVRGAELLRLRKEAETTYMSACAEVRALRAQVADLPTRSATLSDVRRKLELLELGGHAKSLNDYRARRRQDGTWQSIYAAARQAVDSMGSVAENELTIADLDLGNDAGSDSATTSLVLAHENLRRIIEELRTTVVSAVKHAGGRIFGVSVSADMEAWEISVNESEQKYHLVTQQLATAGISNPDEYRDLLQRATTLEQEIKALEKRRDFIETREKEATSALQKYRAFRAELTRRRKTFAASTSGDLVKVEILENATSEGLGEYLRDALSIDAFDDDLKQLVTKGNSSATASWSFAPLDGLVSQLRETLRDPQKRLDTKDRRFEASLRKLKPENIDRVALYIPDDAVNVSFRDPRDETESWRQLSQGSPGQQTAALLAFVLGYGNEPIVLDQPEDDLDNTLIYELLVRRLRERKSTRQVIVVTHNPNIVVHGDAELLVSLESRNGQTQVAFTGGLQEEQARNEICRVMEGGRDAFEARYRRIMLPLGRRNG